MSEAIETAYFKGEGGVIFVMDLPLPEVMAEKLTKGYLIRVNEDGSPYREPSDDDGPPPTTEPPSPAALKPEWVGYAVRVHGLTPDAADAMTKADLIEKFGPKPE